MDKKVLKEAKEKLLQQKKDLQYELHAISRPEGAEEGNYKSRFPNYGEKEDENATEVAVFGDRLAIKETLEKDLRDVNIALESIKKGTYGICKYCQKFIDEKRLVVRPTSSSCVECKKKLLGEV